MILRTVLGPLVFLCYINDLPKEVNSAVKLYVDDVLLHRAIHSTADCEDTLNQWAINWQMSFNLCKCELIQITNKKHPPRHCYYMQEEHIK